MAMFEKVKGFFRASWVAIIVFGGVLLGVVIAVVRACVPKEKPSAPHDPVKDAHERDNYEDLQAKIRALADEELRARESNEAAQKEHDRSQRIERDNKRRKDAENQSSAELRKILLKEASDVLKK